MRTKNLRILERMPDGLCYGISTVNWLLLNSKNKKSNNKTPIMKNKLRFIKYCSPGDSSFNQRSVVITLFQIFCVHGGIPSPENGGGYLSVFEDIPHNLPNPEKESGLAWEVMWSDPLRLMTVYISVASDLSYHRANWTEIFILFLCVLHIRLIQNH